MSTFAALIERADTLKFDDRAKTLSSQIPRDREQALGAFQTSRGLCTESAVIERVEPRGGQVAVTFRADEMEQYECLNRVKSNRWHYDSKTHELAPIMACTKYRTLKVKLNRANPVVIPSSLAAGITPGHLVTLCRGEKTAAPFYVWSSSKRTKLVAMYGVSL